VISNEQMLRDLLRRVTWLERNMPRLRVGEVTDLAPLDVALGGADESYEDVNAIGPLDDGEQVAALVAGGNLLVLGRLLAGAGARFGSDACTWPGGSPRAGNTTITHELGRTPEIAIACASTGVSGVTTIFPVMAAFTKTSTTFLVSAVSSDGSSPASATCGFDWFCL
jgi:hypothetical protein